MTSTKKLNMLIVDDREDNHILMKAFLEGLKDLTIDSAYTAAECFRKLSQNAYGLVFLDLHLPDKNGYEVLKEIKKEYPNVPVYIVSAHAFEEDIEKSKKMGAEGHLVKPIRRATVVDTVKRYLNASFTI
jgi:CheY-like chemotaxis protein